MIHRLRDLWDGSPPWLRRAAGPLVRRLPTRLRLGSVYVDARALIRETERWPAERLAERQAAELRRLVERAYEHTPYYRRVFDEAGVSPAEIRSPADLRRLPLLTRADVAEHREALLARDLPDRARKYLTTGGTSGRPLGFYIDKDSSVIDWAFMISQWERIGFREGDLRVVLRGRVVDDAGGARPWEYDPLRAELTLSSYHMDRDRLARYVELIRRFRPPFLHAYPSTAVILAQYVADEGVELPPFRGALIGSENILDAQREFLERTFGCRVYTWYGHSEKCVLAGECEHDRRYHVFPQYGIAEIVDDDGEPITAPGVPGRLVGTSLISGGMPFIRYLTDDRAQWSEPGPCACGRPYRRLERVTGRWNQEVLVGRSGALLSMAALNLHTDIYTRIRQFQFYQEEPGRAVLRVVPQDDYTAGDREEILREFERKIGHDLELRIERVGSIRQTRRGKYKFVDQRLEVDAPLLAARAGADGG